MTEHVSGGARSVIRASCRVSARARTLGRLSGPTDAVVGRTPRIVRGARLRRGSRTGLGPGCLCMATVVVGADCLILADVRCIGDSHPVHVPGRLNQMPNSFPREVLISQSGASSAPTPFDEAGVSH